MSITTLHQRLKMYGLSISNHRGHPMKYYRGRSNEPFNNLDSSSMWNLLQSKYNILVSRDLVMSALKGIEPNVTEQRKFRKV